MLSWFHSQEQATEIRLETDLYSWREIFQLYVEAEVFESVSEATRGERSVEESEQRLSSFVERVTQRGLGDARRLKMKQSRAALETFLELNMFILNVKKVSSLVPLAQLLVFISAIVPIRKRRSNAEDFEEARETHGSSPPSRFLFIVSFHPSTTHHRPRCHTKDVPSTDPRSSYRRNAPTYYTTS